MQQHPMRAMLGFMMPPATLAFYWPHDYAAKDTENDGDSSYLNSTRRITDAVGERRAPMSLQEEVELAARL